MEHKGVSGQCSCLVISHMINILVLSQSQEYVQPGNGYSCKSVTCLLGRGPMWMMNYRTLRKACNLLHTHASYAVYSAKNSQCQVLDQYQWKSVMMNRAHAYTHT